MQTKYPNEGTVPLKFYQGSSKGPTPQTEKIIETPPTGYNAARRERCERRCEKAGPKTSGKPNFCVAMQGGAI